MYIRVYILVYLKNNSQGKKMRYVGMRGRDRGDRLNRVRSDYQSD